ncbi:MAG: 16S rRNA (cytosine(1402)-N(4))-methyltransferase RsmH [Actinobacteria bacterium]|nr:MAG: 16S rRNA (cytosine(1402)-N(4))-methyltransferase RsmH [Actinomycetota bacterium]
MEYKHKPVLLAEVLEQLVYQNQGTFVDCTLGGAGHAGAILEKIAPSGFIVGIDKDIAAIDAAKTKLSNFSQHFSLIQGNFADLDELLGRVGVGKVNGFLFDLGVSSAQIDQAQRGFSYKQKGPLDMRMDKRNRLSARNIVNNYSKQKLSRIIRDYSEEKWASRIAYFIVKRRSSKPIETTEELVEIVKDAIPAGARRSGPHPAKRVFQALRIEVNSELKALEKGLNDCIKWLVSGGRIAVISYHSLEDRIVKKIFKGNEKGCICPKEIAVCVCRKQPVLKILTKKPIVASKQEIEENPRARSAKLRVAKKK